MASTRTILVVDDDVVTRELMRSLLEADYHLLFARDGHEALELAARSRPDLVLLDIVMPELDGFAVCHRLRQDPGLHQVPIVLLTALEGRDSRLQGLAAGADEFLNKPVDPTELRMRIRTITALNRFRQLCDERARFEVAVAHSPDGIVLTDETGRIVHMNRAFTRLTTPPSPWINDCFPRPTVDILKSRLAAIETGGRVDTFETTLNFAVKTDTMVELTVVRLPWSDGTLLQYILRDVTERKQLEAQLLRLQRIELLGELAGGVVHDVNNLLGGVLSQAELLELKNLDGADENVAVIRHAAERGSALLRRILMFARGDDQDLAPIEIEPILHEVAMMVRSPVQSQTQVQLNVAANLPRILGDSSQLHQLVMNLCVNARDAMPNGGKITISTATASLTREQAQAISGDATEGDFVTVSVQDTGVGIPAENRDRLFDPFFTTKPRESATGLGLATALRVMRRHHGFIACRSHVGSGTCFTCYFPVLLGSPSRAAPTQQ